MNPHPSISFLVELSFIPFPNLLPTQKTISDWQFSAMPFPPCEKKKKKKEEIYKNTPATIPGIIICLRQS